MNSQDPDAALPKAERAKPRARERPLPAKSAKPSQAKPSVVMGRESVDASAEKPLGTMDRVIDGIKWAVDAVTVSRFLLQEVPGWVEDADKAIDSVRAFLRKHSRDSK